jgi:hypothetical protein
LLTTNPRPRATPSETPRDIITRLQEELDSANSKIHRLEREDRGPQVTRSDDPDLMARVIFEWLPLGKRGPVASALMQLHSPNASRDSRRSRPPLRRRTAATDPTTEPTPTGEPE